MVGDFPIEPLRKFGAVQGGFAFKSGDFKTSGIPVFKIKNIRLGEIDTTDVEYVTTDVAQAASRYFCTFGDLLISMTGSGPQAPNSVVGRVARFTGPDHTYLINQRVGRFVIHDRNLLDPRFLFYVLTQREYQWSLVSIATGSANQANISGAQIANLEIPVPPRAQQRAIAHILGTLDDKIELNRRTNETLEAMARALFRSWFVDFDPVRLRQGSGGQVRNSSADSDPLRAEAAAKAGGLPKPLADLFPDSFEDSELGEIPKGWRAARLGDPAFFPLVAPGVPRDVAALVHYIATGDVQRDRISGDTEGVVAALPSRANMQPGNGRVWFAKMKDSPKYLWTMTEDQEWWSHRVLSTGFAGIQATSPAYEALLYCYVSRADFDQAKNQLATGTTMQALNNDTINKLLLVLPPQSVAGQFDSIARPLFRRRWSNSCESRTLANLRDTLLPKLVSGQLRLKDAERIVGGQV